MLNKIYQRRSVIVASLIAIFVVVWVMSGALSNSEASLESTEASDVHVLPQVAVESRFAQSTWRRFDGSGTVETRRAVDVLAAQEGRVVKLNVTEGDEVVAGAALIELSPKHIPQQRALAEAQLAQAELQYQSTKKLFNKGLATPLRLAESKSALEQAKADLEAAKVAVRELILSAPFAGVVEAVDMELGDYVRAGDRGVRLVQKDNLLAVVSVMADVAAELALDTKLELQTRAGKVYEAAVTFVASEPDSRSRLYRVEAEITPVENNLSGLVIGQPVEIRIPLQQVKAHRLAASLLWLNSDGDMGVRAVDESNTVVFYAAEFLRSEAGDVWLTGLPEQFNLIVAGQGLVRTGAEVSLRDQATAE
jgi:multidrug efflux system membrane fusion protein